ncbi:MAG: InlB B-repeat-containing protein [Synergistaceae bacterium]|nr:InlB B-repeat-containing protein [Synergistaceae bacterium]
MRTRRSLTFIIYALLLCLFPAFITGAYADDGAAQSAAVTIGFTVARRQTASVVIGFTKITPVYNITVSGGNITAPSTAKAGDTVTLTYAGEIPAGYDTVVFSVNGTAITGSTFTMPEGDVTITAALTPITYTITYNLDGGSLAEGVSNYTSYTVESDTFTLNNPAKDGCIFTGWIGDELTEAAQTVTIAQGSTGDRTYTANWEEESSGTPSPAFRYNSLILSGQIGVNFYVYIPDDLPNSADCFMTFTISGKGNVSDEAHNLDENITYTDETGKYYGFRCYINSIQMADTITATLHYGENNKNTLTKDMSAKQYLDAFLAEADPENYGVDEKLIAAVKDYGHYAQIMLKNEHGFTLGDDDNSYAVMDGESSFDASDYGKVRVSTDEYAIVNGNVSGSGVSAVMQSLNLDSSTAINLYFDVESTADVSSWKAYIDGEEVDFSHYNDNRYKVVINNISAHKLGKTYTVRLEAAQTFEVKVSALSYVNATLTEYMSDYSKDTNGDCDAVTALYNYYDATMAYRKARGYKD